MNCMDWTIWENMRAQPRILVRRILYTYRSLPGRQKKAAQPVLKEAEGLSERWAVDMDQDLL